MQRPCSHSVRADIYEKQEAFRYYDEAMNQGAYREPFVSLQVQNRSDEHALLATNFPGTPRSHHRITNRNDIGTEQPRSPRHDGSSLWSTSNAQRQIVSNGNVTGVITKTPYIRPEHPKIHCHMCTEQPEGFRGTHELDRHIARAHAPLRKGYVCFDFSPDQKFLANCKHCRSQKIYSAYYNAAAHLRRAHFHPRKRGRQRPGAKRGSIGGDDHPSLDYLKEHWIREVDVANRAPSSPAGSSDEATGPIDASSDPAMGQDTLSVWLAQAEVNNQNVRPGDVTHRDMDVLRSDGAATPQNVLNEQPAMQGTENFCDVAHRKSDTIFRGNAGQGRHKRGVHCSKPREPSYRCAAEDCRNRDKLWPRLDNFKQHIERMHKTEHAPSLIQRSIYDTSGFSNQAPKHYLHTRSRVPSIAFEARAFQDGLEGPEVQRGLLAVRNSERHGRNHDLIHENLQQPALNNIQLEWPSNRHLASGAHQVASDPFTANHHEQAQNDPDSALPDEETCDTTSDPLIGQLTADSRYRCLEPTCSHVSFGRQADFRRHYQHRHSPEKSTTCLQGHQLPPPSNESASPSIIANVTLKGKFRCVRPNCQDMVFSRQGDFCRHHKDNHAERVQFYCPVSGCRRSREPKGGTKSRSFGTREDKMKEHVRNFHEASFLPNELAETANARAQKRKRGDSPNYGAGATQVARAYWRSDDNVVDFLIHETEQNPGGVQIPSYGSGATQVARAHWEVGSASAFPPVEARLGVHWLYQDTFTFPFVPL